MNIIRSILSDFADFFNFKTKRGLFRLFLLGGIVALVFIVFWPAQQGVVEEATQARSVAVASVGSFSDPSSLNLIGTVESVSEATIQSETSGRVTAVNVSLGQNISSGQIIAQLENSSQYAAVVQAEGAYEAAEASANLAKTGNEQNDIALEESNTSVIAAKNAAANSYRSAFNVTNGVVLNTVDQFFSKRGVSIIGLYIDGKGSAVDLINQRKNLTVVLDNWQQKSTTLDNTDQFEVALNEAKANTNSVINLIDKLLALTNSAKNLDTLNGAPVNSYSSILNAERSTLLSVVADLENKLTSLESARKANMRVNVGVSNKSQIAVAEAQVKQALGSLRAAQANYNKTILRTPISGTVNLLNVKVGDFVNAFTTLATIANNDAFLVTTYVGEKDLTRINVGDKVTINNDLPGVVATIAPAVDPVTKKVKIEIQTETDSLSSGATVNINLKSDETKVIVDQIIEIPLTAVKFTATDANVFVIENNLLQAIPVTIGQIRGSSVEILDGIDDSTQIVIDARGLVAGQEVSVIAE